MLKKSVTAATICFLLVSAPFQVEGNQPHWDDGYRIFQDHSPNFVHVEILNVTVTSNKALWFASHSDRVEVEARVLKVVRTANNLRPGMVIPILYDRKAAAGGTFAETPSIPEKGKILPAFIKIKGDHFIPAARHHTFTPLAEQQLKKMDRETVELTKKQIAALRLPDALGGSLQVDTSSELPLEEAEIAVEKTKTAPLKAEVVKIKTEVASTELPLVDPQTPGLITPTIPDAELKIQEPVKATLVEAEVPTESAPALPVVKNTATTEPPAVTTETMGQPIIDTGSTTTAVKPKRRTVIVVPPSKLRSRRQQEIQSALQREQARREAETAVSADIPEPAVAVLKAEAVTSPVTVVETMEVTAPEIPEQIPPADTPITFPLSTAEQTTADKPSYPVLQAEPLQTLEAQVENAASAEVPTPKIETETFEPTVVTSTPAPPRVEPVTITDFTPAPAPDPVATSMDLTEQDRSNMKSYADIYLTLRQASDAAEKQNYDKAKLIYQKALTNLQTLKAANPNFQPFMVEYRIRDTSRKLEKLIENTPKP